jgi:DNA (cytosine-5)-methyltransferase 1
MKYFSTFSGIGGFELGIQQAYENISNPSRKQQGRVSQDSTNIECEQLASQQPACIGYSEIDKYAIQVYNKHFNHKNYGDITTINEKTLPDFELFVGGFPCQSFSIAGKRKGFSDTRGTMFFEIARIIKQKQPRLLLLENVKGLLSHDKGNTFTTIISTLDELGYDCQWQVLNSKNFGVPQNRERVFIIGHLRGTSRPEVFPLEGTTGKNINVDGVLDTETWRKRNESIRRVYGTDGVAPTIPTGTGGGVMPKMFVNEPRFSKYEKSNIAQTVKIGGTIGNVCVAQRGRNGKQVLEKQKGDHTNTITSVQKDNLILRDGRDNRSCLRAGRTTEVGIKGRSIRRLTPKECERLQGFPDNWTKKGQTGEVKEQSLPGKKYKQWSDVVYISDTQRYKMCGNAVTINVVQAIMQKLL